MDSSLKQELFNTFQDVIKQRDQLRLELVHAQETIRLLESEIDATKYHGDKAFAQVADQLGVVRHKFQLTADSDPASYWLDDLWLSVPENAKLLGEAEEAWEKNMVNPQKALNIAARTVKDNINRDDKIKCALFVSAIMLASGRTEEACANANEALRECGHSFMYKNLAGIAHFLRGRVFLELKSLRQAYWDFSLAIFTPGYHERAKHFQQYTENRILQEDHCSAPIQSSDELDNLPPLDLALDRKPILKLAPEIAVPLDGFEFEKPSTTPD